MELIAPLFLPRCAPASIRPWPNLLDSQTTGAMGDRDRTAKHPTQSPQRGGKRAKENPVAQRCPRCERQGAWRPVGLRSLSGHDGKHSLVL